MSEVRERLADHLPAMHRFALSRLKNRHDAEDAVQETAARALRYEDSYRPGTNLEAWLFAILYSAMTDGRRRRMYRAKRESAYRDSREIIVAPSQIPTVHLGETLRAVARLKAEHRDALLRFAGGEEYEEIAAALGVACGTVRSRLSRARDQLAAALA